MSLLKNYFIYFSLVLLIVVMFFPVSVAEAREAKGQCFCHSNSSPPTCTPALESVECRLLYDRPSPETDWKTCDFIAPGAESNGGINTTLAEQEKFAYDVCVAKRDTWVASQPLNIETDNSDSRRILDDLKTRTQSKLNPLKWLGATGTLGVNTFIGKMLIFIMWAIGSLLLLFYVYAGVLWMTAAGNAEQITKAKHILLWATLSIIVQFTSYFLVRALFTLF